MTVSVTVLVLVLTLVVTLVLGVVVVVVCRGGRLGCRGGRSARLSSGWWSRSTVSGDEDVVVGATDRDVVVSGVNEVDSVGASPPVISFARP